MTEEDFGDLVALCALRHMVRDSSYWAGVIRGRFGVVDLHTLGKATNLADTFASKHDLFELVKDAWSAAHPEGCAN